jgi:hypothetical protein
MRLVKAAWFALRLLGAAGALAVVTAPSTRAHAEEPRAAGMVLILDGAPWSLEPEAVRAAVEHELGRPVTLAPAAAPGQASLVLHGEPGGRVSLTYHAEDGRQIRRTIDMPSDPAGGPETVALLAGNLVRDDASELAAALGKRAPAEEESAAPPPVEKSEPPPARTKQTPGAASASGAPVPQPPCARAGVPTVIAGVELVPFVGTSLATGTSVSRHYSLNLLGGYVAGLAGVELGAGFNMESAFMCGVQLAGVANVVTGPVRGLQLAGGLNLATSLEGVQLGGVNVSAGPVTGVQVGFVGIGAGPLAGLQAGGVTVAAGDVTGVQLGGVNVATGKVKGAQIGAINYARRSTFSLGVINIIRDGRLHLDVWGQESGILMAGVKHGSDYFHNIYGAGVRVSSDKPRVAYAFGLGGRITPAERLWIDIDVLAYGLHEVPSFVPAAVVGQARVLVGLRLASRFAVFAGPSYNIAYGRTPEDSQLSPYGALILDPTEPDPVRGWPGLTVGVQAF